MADPWEILVEAGVPDGAARPPAAGELDEPAIRSAVEALGGEIAGLEPRRRELLAAWLGAFRRHWPARFAATLGEAGEALLRALHEAGVDPDRYLKLRRIAIANLAGRI